MLAARTLFKMNGRLLLNRTFCKVILDSSSVKMPKIKDMELSDKTKEVLLGRGFSELFPIQYMTYKDIEEGKDVIAKDKTGSGKTLAYALPLMERLRKSIEEEQIKSHQRKPKVLVLIPTRELAIQVSSEFDKLVHSSNDPLIAAFYGGTSIVAQFKAIKQGIDILVATPGRLIDHIERNSIDLSSIETVVLDETDEMLEIGFKDAIFKILQEIRKKSSNPDKKIQYLLFSATVPPWVKQTAKEFMDKNYKFVDMVRTEEVATPKNIKHILLKADYQREVLDSLSSLVDTYAGMDGKAIIFTNTKREADDLVRGRYIRANTRALHGDVEQSERETIFRNFKDGNINCLVATNVAARGVDFPKVDLVIQVNPPNDAESFIHRSGRTGRAGRSGTSVLIYDESGSRLVKELERVAKVKFERLTIADLSHIKKKAGDDFKRYVMASMQTITQEQMDDCQSEVNQMIEDYGESEALKRLTAYLVMNPVERRNMRQSSKYSSRNEGSSNSRSNSDQRSSGFKDSLLPDNDEIEERKYEKVFGRGYAASNQEMPDFNKDSDSIFISNVMNKAQVSELESLLQNQGFDFKVSFVREPTGDRNGFAFASIDSLNSLNKLLTRNMIMVGGSPLYLRRKN